MEPKLSGSVSYLTAIMFPSTSLHELPMFIKCLEVICRIYIQPLRDGTAAFITMWKTKARPVLPLFPLKLLSHISWLHSEYGTQHAKNSTFPIKYHDYITHRPNCFFFLVLEHLSLNSLRLFQLCWFEHFRTWCRTKPHNVGFAVVICYLIKPFPFDQTCNYS